MFRKVLVANRGEIAVRVLRACRDLGVRGIAVYSEPDATALHARYAEEAYCIGGGPAAESYLNAEKIIATARACGAEAIHPGYGFLSEQAEFARSCREADIVFIGPPEDALRRLGDKVEARRIAEEAGVPAVPGTSGRVNPEEAASAAESIGYPLLVKAVSGGGGKGIRRVDEAPALEAALRTAAAEAEASFGDAGLYIEKYLDPVRHIEVQVLADRHGNVLHLGERECSVQRRSQKLVEESPSTAVDQSLRQRLGEAAVAIAREAGYENAGTVEFLLDEGGNFYFIEANARLQVEHPVTELVTGIDLVCEQLRIAAGEPLRFSQDEIELRGWAIECRIMAEDAEAGFLPSLGRVDLVTEPSGPGIRVDSCLFPGMEVGPHYDSLLGKVIAWGKDRPEAMHRMRRALAESQVLGIQTTVPLHRQLLHDPAFVAGDLDTHFLERRFAPQDGQPQDEAALLAAALISHKRRAGNGLGSGGVSAWKSAGRRSLVDPPGGASWRGTF